MNIFRRTLRLFNIYTQLRSYRLEMWQPMNCAVMGQGHWMPHNEEASTQDLRDNNPFIDAAWKETHKNTILRHCSAVNKAIIHSLYRRLGLCEDDNLVNPWVMSKHRRVCLASYERDVKAIHKLLFKHDTLFTLARHYDLPADHNIVNVLHQHLVSSTNNSSGIDGLDDTRPLDQIVCVLKAIFEDSRAIHTFLFG